MTAQVSASRPAIHKGGGGWLGLSGAHHPDQPLERRSQMDDGIDRSLAAFMYSYAGDDSVALDLDVQTFKAEHHNDTPLIIIRDRGYVAVINPMAIGTYLDIDVHSFVDGQEAGAGVMGMTGGNRIDGFRAEDTPLRSNGWPAANLVALFIGEQTQAVAGL